MPMSALRKVTLEHVRSLSGAKARDVLATLVVNINATRTTVTNSLMDALKNPLPIGNLDHTSLRYESTELGFPDAIEKLGWTQPGEVSMDVVGVGDGGGLADQGSDAERDSERGSSEAELEKSDSGLAIRQEKRKKAVKKSRSALDGGESESDDAILTTRTAKKPDRSGPREVDTRKPKKSKGKHNEDDVQQTKKKKKAKRGKSKKAKQKAKVDNATAIDAVKLGNAPTKTYSEPKGKETAPLGDPSSSCGHEKGVSSTGGRSANELAFMRAGESSQDAAAYPFPNGSFNNQSGGSRKHGRNDSQDDTPMRPDKKGRLADVQQTGCLQQAPPASFQNPEMQLPLRSRSHGATPSFLRPIPSSTRRGSQRILKLNLKKDASAKETSPAIKIEEEDDDNDVQMFLEPITPFKATQSCTSPEQSFRGRQRAGLENDVAFVSPARLPYLATPSKNAGSLPQTPMANSHTPRAQQPASRISHQKNSSIKQPNEITTGEREFRCKHCSVWYRESQNTAGLCRSWHTGEVYEDPTLPKEPGRWKCCGRRAVYKNGIPHRHMRGCTFPRHVWDSTAPRYSTTQLK
ncbi:hypothetical protein M406DRAFT_331766 [Cryphonectria parasitica EP155]|uniref:Uncharacterized protein n=1 Tax=Cryphonectria parasitica (strain ATCC 38755 / EP155) TaxID=660469 RepID=A0A9P4XYQ6_CRYP1|nr:uncharacterized protein M406DRAFT_331766 [Cryphonectria parasitica EP155]KAF3763227.1 hypothetical protein M406DRAFT_331766 [Cryphonectria parasitica EP155]